MRPSSRVRDCLLALLACAAAAFGLRSLTPPPTAYGLGAKLDYFAEHKDEFDIVLIGSSRVYRSFVAEILDSELSKRGHPLRSFNLGIPGMSDLEADAILREVLALRPERLKLVVLEPGRFDAAFHANRFTPRNLNWHTTHVTLTAVERAQHTRGTAADRRDLILLHVEHWMRRLLNIGQGRRILSGAFQGDTDRVRHGLDATVLAETGGYRALEEESGAEFERRRAEFLASPAVHAARVDETTTLLRERRDEPLPAHFPIHLFEEQAGSIQAAGATPVYILVPGANTQPAVLALHRAGHIPELLNFNDPERYPEFFTPESRFDKNHLSRDSAAQFSAVVAQRLADILDSAAN